MWEPSKLLFSNPHITTMANDIRGPQYVIAPRGRSGGVAMHLIGVNAGRPPTAPILNRNATVTTGRDYHIGVAHRMSKDALAGEAGCGITNTGIRSMGA